MLLCTAIVSLTTACSPDKNNFHLRGNITGLKDTVVTLYGIFYNPDSVTAVPVDNGTFSCDMQLDTITPLYLRINSLDREYPIFADKLTTVQIEGEATGDLRISGGEAQQAYNAFADSVRYLKDDELLRQAADSFIAQNPQSVVSIYLIEKYFVQSPHPDKARIEAAIEKLSGIMHDHPYMARLQDKLDEGGLKRKDRYIQLTTQPDTTGQTLGIAPFKDKYIVLTLWASWHQPSVEWQDSLKAVVKAFAKRPVQFVSFSLDTDREQWLSSIRKDTLSGFHLCDFRGWNSPTVQLSGAADLPYTLILNSNNKVLVGGASDFNLTQQLDKQLDEWETVLKNRKKKRK